MINGKTVLGIIPARGGSKRLFGKNIKLLAGKPLVAYTIEEAKKSKYIDRLILTSEDKKIIKIAKEYGCEVPFVRPKELAKDNTPGIQPVLHTLNTIEEKYNYVCLLQPTSPLRNVKHIDECIEKCVSMNAKSCVSVVESECSPYWMYSILSNNKLKPIINSPLITLHQELPKVFSLNGAVYVSSVNNLLNNKSFITEDSIAFVMDKYSSIDIDDDLDWLVAEIIINNNSKSIDS